MPRLRALRSRRSFAALSMVPVLAAAVAITVFSAIGDADAKSTRAPNVGTALFVKKPHAGHAASSSSLPAPPATSSAVPPPTSSAAAPPSSAAPTTTAPTSTAVVPSTSVPPSTTAAAGTTSAPATSAPATPTTATAPATSSAAVNATMSGAPMPVGDVVTASGTWRQIWSDDFTTSQSTGAFPGAYTDMIAYGPNWTDTSGRGNYNPDIISFHDGVMDLHLHSVNGVPQVAAPVPMLNPASPWTGQVSGRYTVRFKSDALNGYKTAWLLWPDSSHDADNGAGEIDFPEGNLNSTIGAYSHCLGANSATNCSYAITPATYGAWHTATMEWKAGQSITWYLDGQMIGQLTNAAEVPTVAMHWVLQTETVLSGEPIDTQADGHMLVDWAAIYAWKPN